VKTLPEPEVVSCYFDDGFVPHLAAMRLRWPAAGAELWRLPDGLRRDGPPPDRFGISIQRRDNDLYSVCLVWNDTGFHWGMLNSAQLLGGDVESILGALGTDLRRLLDQPICPTRRTLTQAA
jgi:hypothetical protein